MAPLHVEVWFTTPEGTPVNSTSVGKHGRVYDLTFDDLMNLILNRCGYQRKFKDDNGIIEYEADHVEPYAVGGFIQISVAKEKFHTESYGLFRNKTRKYPYTRYEPIGYVRANLVERISIQ